MEGGTEPVFVDIKISSPFHMLKAAILVGGSLYLQLWEQKYPIFYKRSFGYYHANFGMLFGDNSSTIRLTLGLDPSQVDVFVGCLEKIDALNEH